MLDEDGRWPPTSAQAVSATGPFDAVGLIAAAPGAVEDLRARLTG